MFLKLKQLTVNILKHCKHNPLLKNYFVFFPFYLYFKKIMRRDFARFLSVCQLVQLVYCNVMRWWGSTLTRRYYTSIWNHNAWRHDTFDFSKVLCFTLYFGANAPGTSITSLTTVIKLTKFHFISPSINNSKFIFFFIGIELIQFRYFRWISFFQMFIIPR